jgi:hypothetical protein
MVPLLYSSVVSSQRSVTVPAYSVSLNLKSLSSYCNIEHRIMAAGLKLEELSYDADQIHDRCQC